MRYVCFLLAYFSLTHFPFLLSPYYLSINYQYFPNHPFYTSPCSSSQLLTSRYPMRSCGSQNILFAIQCFLSLYQRTLLKRYVTLHTHTHEHVPIIRQIFSIHACAMQILIVGKSINLLRRRCHDNTQLFSDAQRSWFLTETGALIKVLSLHFLTKSSVLCSLIISSLPTPLLLISLILGLLSSPPCSSLCRRGQFSIHDRSKFGCNCQYHLHGDQPTPP